MNVKYYLDGRNEPKIIFCRISRLSIKFSTKLNCNSDKWDSAIQRPKRNPELKRTLDDVEFLIHNHHNACIRANKLITKESILHHLSQETTLFGAKQDSNQFKCFSQMFYDSKLPSWSKGYAKGYRTFMTSINDRYPNLCLSDITPAWIDNFISAEHEHYLSETINTRLTKFKAILRLAVAENVIPRCEHLIQRMKIKVYHADKIRLTDEEMELWFSKLLTMDQRLFNASCGFLLGYYTGLRYSDFTARQTVKFYQDDTLIYRVFPKKTKKAISFPSNERIEYLLSLEVKPISNQKSNSYIKEAAKFVGLNDLIWHDGVEIEKYKLVTTHTARRSYATNAIMKGIPRDMVMAVTGHKTEKDFNKYIRFTDIEMAVRLSQFQKDMVQYKKGLEQSS